MHPTACGRYGVRPQNGALNGTLRRVWRAAAGRSPPPGPQCWSPGFSRFRPHTG